jgi:hypothetical protein
MIPEILLGMLLVGVVWLIWVPPVELGPTLCAELELELVMVSLELGW